MAKTSQTLRVRAAMSEAQKELLSRRQREYVANDPRWAEHRAKLAKAQQDPDQKARLATAQLSYMASDPRWPDHRARMQAAALEVTRLSLLPEEIDRAVNLRSKGRTFEYIGEELCVSDRIVRREFKAIGIPTGKVKADRRAKPSSKGHWRCRDAI